LLKMPADEDQQHRAQHRADAARAAESIAPGTAVAPTGGKPGDERTTDAEQYGVSDAHRHAAGIEPTCEQADQEAAQDHRQKIEHSALALFAVRAVPSLVKVAPATVDKPSGGSGQHHCPQDRALGQNFLCPPLIGA